MRCRWIFLLSGLGTIGCGALPGGSEAGNPAAVEREVTGSVPEAETNVKTLVLEQASGNGCVADEVSALDSRGNEIAEPVASDCSFQIKLKVGKAYRLRLLLQEEFVASLEFSQDSGLFASPTLVLSQGSDPIALGLIKVKGRKGTPTDEPSRQGDRDGDGIKDIDDSDDDGDGTLDEAETDCDLDGILDDLDEDSSCAATAVDEVKVFEVRPPNDPQPELGQNTIDLDEEVKVRIACDVDLATLNSNTFQVASSSHAISCQFSGVTSGKRIVCEHKDVLFRPGDVYTATLEGVKCADGKGVEKRSWRWKTESGD